MTVEKALKALRQMKISCSATQLAELEYTIKILEKLLKEGINDAMSVDFSKLK